MYQPPIIQHLFQASSLEDVSRERLEAFVESYPSYGMGHYLLSCKLQAEGSDKFLPETQLTCLYFSNPLWLQWLLQHTDGAVAVGAAAPEPATAYSDTPAANGSAEDALATDAFTTNADTPVSNVVTMAEEAYAGPATGDDLAEALTTSETETVTPLEIDSTTAGEGEQLTAAETTQETTHETARETTSDAGEPSAADLLLRSIQEARDLRDSMQEPDEEGLSSETAIAGGSLTETAAPQEESIHDEEAPFVLEEPADEPEHTTEEIAETPTPVDAAAPVVEMPMEEQPVAEVMTQAVSEAPAEATSQAVSDSPAEVTTQAMSEETAPAVSEAQREVVPEAKPAEPEAPQKPVAATQDFLFEPYHTIDYFASQGIKLTLDENPTDHLGKQLKSFTDWLKTMRRLPQKDREVVPDRVVEQAIQTIAAHSIQGKDVLTETMAEVLAKQGMREKARAVYEKLSLLNPDKSAYFAAKIEQLNIP